MRQYHSLKEQVPHALLMFRLGDFYELFYDDAVTAARELGITLTARNKEKGQPVPMCGVPYHAVEGYLGKLIQKGYRVALCEQMEQPSAKTKLVRRDITRIVTPGTATESNLLRAKENNYLAAVTSREGRAGVAHVDISTGEFRVTEVAEAEAAPLMEALGVREVLVSEGGPPVSCMKTVQEAWVFGADYAGRTLREHFQLLSLDGCGLAGRDLAVGAAGAVLHYLKDTQRAALDHLARPAWYSRNESMVLDAVTVRNLELVEPLFHEDAGSKRDATLLGVIDETLTGMGARLLRRRILEPSMDAEEIAARLDAVEEVSRQTIVRADLRKILPRILDIERLLAKVTLGSAAPRELLALGRSLAELPAIAAALAGLRAERIIRLLRDLPGLTEVRSRILDGIAEEPPVNIADGGTIRSGVSEELDGLRDIQTNSKQYLAAIETRERERTGIQSLKVRFNNVFGYYLEISKANLHLAPEDYDRKQTLVNAERFTTPELNELEAKILEAEEKILAIEKELFHQIRLFVASEAATIRLAASIVADIDVFAALAQLAVERRYVRPGFSDAGILRVEGGRHPVIERLAERDAQRFIPNDLYLDNDRFLAVITGPNMGGKSTYLRQAALLSVMAQAGSFVPAGNATLPLVDRVFTRIGASDNLSRGRSTFMVEMTEAAMILNTATARSLIILDEIGRGTSTWDGLALAWSIAEYVHNRIGAKTLFATHYHELTELAGNLPHVVNLRVTVKEAGDQILFLRKVEPGAADKSYGIEVARLAALPEAVIDRAREVLSLHERSETRVSEELAPADGDRGRSPLQIQLFEPVNYQIAERIRQLNVDELRPIEALQLLGELQRELKRT